VCALDNGRRARRRVRCALRTTRYPRTALLDPCCSTHSLLLLFTIIGIIIWYYVVRVDNVAMTRVRPRGVTNISPIVIIGYQRNTRTRIHTHTHTHLYFLPHRDVCARASVCACVCVCVCAEFIPPQR